MRIIQTIGIVCQGPKVLLGMKLRGFGAGLWNGPGGKFNGQKDKSVEESFRRETQEESKLTIGQVEEVGYIEFEFADKLGEILETRIFRVLHCAAQPQDTEEMRWRWFDEARIPYEMMWPADKFWLPIILSRKSVRGWVLYDSKESRNILDKNLEIAVRV